MLAAFREAYPAMHLQIAVNNGFLNLSRREADIAVRPSNTPPENFAGRNLGMLRAAPYASKNYLSRFPDDGGSEADWSKYEWVAPDEALGHLRQARWLHEHVPPERYAASVDSLLGMAAAAEAGMLLCLLADSRPQLVRLAEPPAALDTEVWILTHPDLRRLKRIRVFIDFLYEPLAGYPALA
jgi:DNA-binding transcriptional LysR family regulator